MRKSKFGVVVGLSTALGFLGGCSDTATDNQTTTNSASATLQGSVFKGPVDNAIVQVTDAKGVILATGQSQQGRFQIIDVPIKNQKIVIIKSFGGNYVDEASGQSVNPGVNSGLMTVLNESELQSLAKTGQPVVLTPETTIVAKIVEQKLANGMSESQAITTAETLVNKQLLDGTSPIPGVATETVMRIGDAATSKPTEQGQALARNRAMSFSYETKNMGLAPQQVFELLDNRATDLLDGVLDGKQGDTLINMVDISGNSVSLDNQKTTYSMARAELLNTMVNRYIMGQGTADEHVELEAMGMDMQLLDQAQQQNSQAQAITTANLAATNLPDFQFLPLLQDEDGNPSDNAATYTLDVIENVNVTINSPGGSWTTPMMRYNGLQHAPVISARRGDQMTFKVNNTLNEETTVHWHGFKIPGDQDGGPDFPIQAGTSKDYNFSMLQAAAPLWFHPHPHEKTATQVYNGLAGGFVLKDAITDQLESGKQLPTDKYDIPLLIQDRRFADDDGTGVRSLIYDGTMAAGIVGMLGNTILVNDVELPGLKVDTHKYRFRIYNGSNARTYSIALHNSATFYVIATDGGLLPAPVEADHIVLSAGERAEIVIDFGAFSVGDRVMLVSRPFNGNQMSMMTGDSNMMETKMHPGGGMPGGNMPGGGGISGEMFNGAAFDIMRFDVTTQVTDGVVLYATLPANADIYKRLTAADADRNREFVMSMGMGNMQFLINGKSFDINRVDELIPSGATEIWTIRNASMMAHPFHAHAIQWQILDRNNVTAAGVDLGWKDTVLVQPGETVRIMGRFDPVVNSGKYMYHCHILEHEDTGMMGIFEIQ